MKKVLFALCAAVLTLGMVSCNNPKEDPKTDVVLSIDPAEVTLALDEEIRLKVVVEPKGETVTPTWTSSNTKVATVSKAGLVTAVADGDCVITVSAPGAKDGTCKVTVSSTKVYDSFSAIDYGIFGDSPILVEGSDTVIETSVGPLPCQLMIYPYVLTWDGDLMFANGSGWSGAGLSAEIPDVPFYEVSEGEYAGALISMGGVAVADLKGAVVPIYGQSGAFNQTEMAKFYNSFFPVVYQETADPATIDWDAMLNGAPGAQIGYVDTNEEWWSTDYGQYYAHIKNMIFKDDKEEGLLLYGDIEWHEFVDDNYYFGLKVNFDTKGNPESVVEPLQYRGISKHYEDFTPSANAPVKYELIDKSRIHKEIPAWVHNRKTNIMYKK